MKRFGSSLTLFILLGVIFSGCKISITGTSEHTAYVCVVDGDTINVPNDTTGTRCADAESIKEAADSLADEAADSLKNETQD